MTIVRCPICNEEVAGAGQDVLTTNLRTHMAGVHGLEKQLFPERRPYMGTRDDYQRPADQCSEQQYLGACVDKPRERGAAGYIGRSEWEEGRKGEEQFIGTKDEFEGQKGRDRSRQYVGAREDYARPGDQCQEQQYLGTCVNEPGEAASVLCPLCGQQLLGNFDQELSNNLCDHFAQKHDLR